MTEFTLTADEREVLETFVRVTREGEMAQAKELFKSTRSRQRIAATHSAYLSDWEQTRVRMLAALKNGTLPPNTSETLYRAMIEETEKIVEDKLHFVQLMFEMTFGVSIFNYLRPDGKVARWFGLFG